MTPIPGRQRAMLLASLLLALVVPAPVPVPPKAQVDVRAECLKRCAGAPKDASGTRLLQCLQSCEPATDAGVP